MMDLRLTPPVCHLPRRAARAVHLLKVRERHGPVWGVRGDVPGGEVGTTPSRIPPRSQRLRGESQFSFHRGKAETLQKPQQNHKKYFRKIVVAPFS
jgi:hypothetical protein